MDNLDIKYNRNIHADAESERKELTGQLHPEVHKRVKQQLQAKRKWVDDLRAAITAEMTQLDHEVYAVRTLEQIGHDFKDKLNNLTDKEWRQLFFTLDMQIHVRDISAVTTWANDWINRYYYLSGD